MRNKPVAPHVEHKPGDVHTAAVTTHPAFAEIVANHVSVGGGPLYLYGSDFSHSHAVTIAIKRSELHRSTLHYDNHFGREEIISVVMSEAQWAAFVASPNQGGGICCTLEHVNGKQVPGIACVEDRRAQINDELRRRMIEVNTDLKRLQELVEKGGGKREMRSLLSGIVAEMGPNIDFVMRQFGEHVEETIVAAKVEIEAHIASAVNRTGLAVLRGEKPPFTLLDKSK